MKLAYGYTIEPEGNDPLVDIADAALSQFSQASEPGVWLVDILPFRTLFKQLSHLGISTHIVILFFPPRQLIVKHVPNWVPGTGFKRMAEAWHTTLTELAEKPFPFVKQQMVSCLSHNVSRILFLHSVMKDAGVNTPSYTSDLLTRAEPDDEEELHVTKWSAASLYAAGSGTVCSRLYCAARLSHIVLHTFYHTPCRLFQPSTPSSSP